MRTKIFRYFPYNRGISIANLHKAYGQQIEDKSWQVRGEDSESRCSDLSTSKARIAKDGGKVSHKPKRIHGKIGTRGLLSETFVGGILSLERKKAEEALKKAEECIQWYAREREFALQSISEIDALQAQLTTDVDVEAENNAETETKTE